MSVHQKLAAMDVEESAVVPRCQSPSHGGEDRMVLHSIISERFWELAYIHTYVYNYIYIYIYIYCIYIYILRIYIYIFFFSLWHIVAFCCGHHAVQIRNLAGSSMCEVSTHVIAKILAAHVFTLLQEGFRHLMCRGLLARVKGPDESFSHAFAKCRSILLENRGLPMPRLVFPNRLSLR